MPPSDPSPPFAPAASASPDPWAYLRRYTAARIALGRTGGSAPTTAVLDFRLAHARARDAVLAPFDSAALARSLAAAGLDSQVLSTAATDRRTYLLRPDLGRQLAPASRAALSREAAVRLRAPDLAIIVSDGLAPAAPEHHAVATLVPLIAALRNTGWEVSPIYIVPFARVKIQDEISALVGARTALMLLGERPGLSAPDSLGAYFTAVAGPDRTDADRNCVSNIRPAGLTPALAARKLAWLLETSRRTGLCGLALKDTLAADALPPGRG